MIYNTHWPIVDKSWSVFMNLRLWLPSPNFVRMRYSKVSDVANPKNPSDGVINQCNQIWLTVKYPYLVRCRFPFKTFI